jgi:hypothetical protein
MSETLVIFITHCGRNLYGIAYAGAFKAVRIVTLTVIFMLCDNNKDIRLYLPVESGFFYVCCDDPICNRLHIDLPHM